MAKNTKLVLTVNLVIFVLIFLLHLIRGFTGFSAQFGNWVVPVWLSGVAALVALVLVYLNYKAL